MENGKKKSGKPFWQRMITAGFCLFLTGCTAGKPAEPGGEPSMVPNQSDLYATGTLEEVRYESSGGSMEFHSEFLADIKEDEIVEAEYWAEMSDDEITRLSHAPVDKEIWKDIVKITDTLRTFMSVRKELDCLPEVFPAPDPKFEVLDGGDYQRLYLTMTDGERRQIYACVIPQDRRFNTLRELLKEAVDPKGREIPWYEAPEINGIYIHSDQKGWSYQCTKREDEWMYRAYWKEKGKNQSYGADVSEEVWNRIHDWLVEQNVEQYAAGSGKSPGGTLYLTDGRQKSFHMPEAVAEESRRWFAELTKGLSEEQK